MFIYDTGPKDKGIQGSADDTIYPSIVKKGKETQHELKISGIGAKHHLREVEQFVWTIILDEAFTRKTRNIKLQDIRKLTSTNNIQCSVLKIQTLITQAPGAINEERDSSSCR